MGFVGRERELADLRGFLEIVRSGTRADRGLAVTIQGRRRVGKSRLVDEFTRRAGVPFVYFQAARRAHIGDELAELARSVATSNLPDAAIAADNRPQSLTAALTLLAAALPEEPTVVVIDELPWLLEQVDSGAGELQRVWDMRLSKVPVLLLLLGSDVAMMEQLLGPDHPFFGRATSMALDPLNPADIARMTNTGAIAAFDAYLATGGLPLVAQEWVPGETLDMFLTRSFSASTSALVVSGMRTLDSEFPETSLARQVLTAIGGRGERTFTAIQRAVGAHATTLDTALGALRRARIITADEPLSARPSPKNRRYRIADPALRFWLAFVEPALAEVDRARPDLAMARVTAGYAPWRGRTIEPVVRTALERLLPDSAWPRVQQVGGWWPRNNIPEVDLVGMGRDVEFVGTIKWRTGPLEHADLTALGRDAAAVPGARVGTPLIGVCPGGSAADGFTTVWDASDLLAAW
ncbi:MAG: AAA family ATPase [Micrococcales bacterium]|nr:AAA family ATPase [Micrococcales bacterium]